MNNSQNDEIEIDLVELFFVLLQRIKLIIFVTIIGAVAAFFGTKFLITPIYSSTSMIYLVGDSLDVSSLVNMQVGSALTADYQVIATSQPIVERVIENLDLDMTYEQLKGCIEVSNETDTHIIVLKVSNPDANLAKEIVDELTAVVVDQSADIMDSAEPNIIQKGCLNAQPDSPNVVKNTIIGMFLAFIIIVGILTIRYVMNDTIKTQEDIEKYLGLNTLGMIPADANLAKKTKKESKKKKNKKNR